MLCIDYLKGGIVLESPESHPKCLAFLFGPPRIEFPAGVREREKVSFYLSTRRFFFASCAELWYLNELQIFCLAKWAFDDSNENHLYTLYSIYRRLLGLSQFNSMLSNKSIIRKTSIEFFFLLAFYNYLYFRWTSGSSTIWISLGGYRISRWKYFTMQLSLMRKQSDTAKTWNLLYNKRTMIFFCFCWKHTQISNIKFLVSNSHPFLLILLEFQTQEMILLRT